MVVSQTEDILEAVACGDMEAVKYLVEEKRVSLNVVNEHSQTVAHIAIDKGHLNILKYVLSFDEGLLQAEDCVGNRPIHLAVERGNLFVIRYLVEERGDDIFAKIESRLGNTAVHLAVQEGHLPVVQYFIEERYANFNLRNQIGESLLFIAAQNQHMHVIKYLVEKWNADVNMEDDSQQSILFVSAKVGDLRIPEYLLDERNITSLDVNKRDLGGRTIIYYAAAFGWLDFIKYFVEEKKADFNIPDFQKSTPLHQAAAADNVKVVMYLVGRKANAEAQDGSGKTPLDVATDTQVIRFLKRATHQRMVRSILKPSLEHQSISMLDKRVTDDFITGNKFKLLGDKNAPVHHFSRASSSFMDCFLLLVNAFVTHQRAEYLTPSEKIIRTKMDPIAVATVNCNDTYLEFERLLH